MSIVIYSIVLHVYNFYTNGIIQGLSRIWPRNEKMVSIWKSFASIYHISRLIKKSHMIQYPLDKHLNRLQDKMFFNVWMYCVRFHGFLNPIDIWGWKILCHGCHMCIAGCSACNTLYAWQWKMSPVTLPNYEIMGKRKWANTHQLLKRGTK